MFNKSTILEQKIRNLSANAGRQLTAEILLVLMLFSSSISYANPTGGRVVAGIADIAQQAAKLDVNQASQRAVINWQSFSIGRSEQVNFNQPNRDSSTLNRVIGDNPSALLGKMTANGNVYLVNQNGIMVGKDAQINVGSLIASTANISNQNFMDGRMKFDQPGKQDVKIINQGSITAQQGGLVALVAPGVENQGVINVRLGKIALAGGDAFTLDFYGDQLINFTITKEQLQKIPGADGKPLSHYVSNSGEIIADGGVVAISAETGKAVLDSFINIKGHIQAQTVDKRRGAVALLGDENTQVNVKGTIDASGKAVSAQGGKVEIRAGQVNLQNGSLIDVAAQGHGGTVLVGGDYQGSGHGVRAKTTSVARGAVINADSKSNGNGGKVIVWADNHTSFDGNISARAGQQAGNGGLVEVSGKKTLHFDGDVDASAAHGKAGQLLLDPGDLIVKKMTAKENETAARPDGNGTLSTTKDAAVNVDKVNYLLQRGTSVALKASNDLTIAAKIDGRAINGATGAGASLTAGRNANINEDIITNNGAININALSGNVIMANGKGLYAGNNTINLSAHKNIDAQHLASTGAIKLTAGGAVALNQNLVGTQGTNQQPTGIGSLHVDANSIAVHGNVKTNNGSQTYQTQGGNFVLDRGKNKEANRLDSGTGKVTIATKGIGDVILNGTVLSKQAGLKITTESGDVSFNEALGYAKKDTNGKETPDPATAIGSVQVKAGGKITVAEDWNLSGNNADCKSGDCSVKLIQTGGNDIVINSRIKTATGNILIGSDNLSKTDFGNDQIWLGNSILTEGVGSSIFMNGNLHLVNSGRTDIINRVVIEPTNNVRNDKFPAITLSAIKGGIDVSGKITGLLKTNDKEIGFEKWETSPGFSGNGAIIRFVTIDNNNLKVLNNFGDISAMRLFDSQNKPCCKADRFGDFVDDGSGLGGGTDNETILNQSGELKNQNKEFHFVAFQGIVSQNETTTQIDLDGNVIVTGNVDPVKVSSGQEGSFNLSEFNQLNSSINQNVGGTHVVDPDFGTGGSVSVSSGSLSKQTLTYANQTKDEQKTDNNISVDDAGVILLSSNSDAENADLGRSSPEAGAIQGSYKATGPAITKKSKKIKRGR